MDSFYGGKQGISFVIKARFDSVDQMKQCFQDADYKAVWYGEYCIIDTINKNDKDNGMVFRRTLNTAGDTGDGCAEYIGQIVGPAGGTPNIELGSLDNTLNSFNDLRPTPPETDPAENTAIYYNNGSEYISNFSSTPAIFTSATASSIQYKSGKDYYNTVTPTLSVTPALRYNWYNFRAANSDDSGFAPAKIVIGFEIPYQYNEIEAVYGLDFNSSPTINVTSPNDFYNKYTLGIPRGIPGAYVTNIRKVQQVEPEIYSDFNQLIYSYNSADNTISYTTNENYHNFGDYTGAFWACDFVYPIGTKDGNGQPVLSSPIPIFIGTVREVQDIDLSDDGNLIISYNDGTTSSPNVKVKWIENVTLNDEGTLTFKYNFDEPYYQQIRNATGNPSEQGWYINTATAGATPVYIAATATMVDSATTYYKQIAPSFTTTGNQITWINGINFNPNNGMLSVSYNNNTITAASAWNMNMLKNIELIGNINADSSNADAVRRLKYLTTLNGQGTYIGNEINYIQEMIVTTDRHLLVLFNSKDYRDPVIEGYEFDNDSAQVLPTNYLENPDTIKWRRKFSSAYLATKGLNLDPYCADLTFVTNDNEKSVWYKDLGPLDVHIDNGQYKLEGDYDGSDVSIKSALGASNIPQVSGTVVEVIDTDGVSGSTTIWIMLKEYDSSANSGAGGFVDVWTKVGERGDTSAFVSAYQKTATGSTIGPLNTLTFENQNLTVSYTPYPYQPWS